MESKNILMMVGDYVEDYEAMCIYQILECLGYLVHTVCPGKKPGDKVKTAVHDFLDGEQTYNEKLGHNFNINYDFNQVSVDNYVGLMIPGGRAPEYLRLNKRLIEIVKEFNSKGKLIGAICHGPQILVAADVLKGVEMTAYPACEPELTLAGATWKVPNDTFNNVVVSRNIVTAPAWPAHSNFVRKFVEMLGAKISI
jgi:protease I